MSHHRSEESCECGDPLCPVHKGRDKCTLPFVHYLVRVDMDRASVLMCEGCADDALDSGVFAIADVEEGDWEGD